MSNRKFELVPDQSIEVFGRPLFRIRALRDFGDVRVGDIGGYIERELNLSHDDNAWMHDNAQVYGDAWVFGNAQVYDSAQVYGDAQVFGNAQVHGNACVSGNAQVYGDARVFGDARVYGDAQVHGNAQVFGNAQVHGNAWVSGDAWVSGNARVCDDTSICWFSPVGSESGTLTAFTTERGIYCTRGCFLGTLEEFEAAVKETHGNSRIAAEYSLLIQFISMRLGDAQARLTEKSAAA